MKKLTVEEVMKALQENESVEYGRGAEEWGNYYYLHITDEGEIVSGETDADESFACSINPEAYDGKDYDWREEVEVPENPYFMAVVEDLTDQANDYLGF